MVISTRGKRTRQLAGRAPRIPLALRRVAADARRVAYVASDHKGRGIGWERRVRHAEGTRAQSLGRLDGLRVDADSGEGRDAGAGFVEYAGLMILIAGIYTLIDQLGLDGKISQAIGNAVNDVIGA